MSKTLYPTQIGFVPSPEISGVQTNQSEVVIGKDVEVNWEAIGFGPGGRPDYAKKLVINLTTIQKNVKSRVAKVTLDADALFELLNKNSKAPKQVNLVPKEVSVCEMVNGAAVEKKMIIIASETYDAS